MRNAYHWMAKPRHEDYKPDKRRKGAVPTEFDRWLRHMNWSMRVAALELDIPEARIVHLRSGWRGGRLNGGIVPSFATRYAMVALAAGLRPVPENPDCVDLRDRLAQAAHDAGLDPWPAGEKFARNPNARSKGPLAGAEPVAEKIKREREKRFSKNISRFSSKKNVLVPRA